MIILLHSFHRQFLLLFLFFLILSSSKSYFLHLKTRLSQSMHKRTHAHTHIHTHARTHAHKHTCTHACTNTTTPTARPETLLTCRYLPWVSSLPFHRIGKTTCWGNRTERSLLLHLSHVLIGRHPCPSLCTCGIDSDLILKVIEITMQRLCYAVWLQ